MQGFRILKKIAGKQWDSLTADRPGPAKGADRDLPLGLRLNGLVDVDETDFILAGSDLLTRHPGERLIVRAVGRAELWGAIRLYRFYLQKAEAEAMLQVACDFQGAVEEVHLFRTLDEVYPASADDWSVWLDAERGLIGWRDFSVTLGDRQLVHARTWQPEAGPYLAPAEFEETLCRDPSGQTAQIVQHRVMLYHRPVKPDLAEYLMLSAEESEGEALVRIMSGVSLLPSQLTIV